MTLAYTFVFGGLAQK